MAPNKALRKARGDGHLCHMLAGSKELAARKCRVRQKGPKNYFDLLGLPTEIIVQILKEFPPFLPDGRYRIDNLDDVHPCLALCSASSFVRECYTVYIGKLPDSIEVTIRPADYLVDGGVDGGGFAKMQEKLDQRLSLLGKEGQFNIYKIRIFGPDLDLTTKDDRLNRILEQAKNHDAPKRLSPPHKILLKEHIEQEIIRKTNTAKDLFKCLDTLFVRSPYGEVELCPRQLPASAWLDVLKDYILDNPLLYAFDFISARHEESTDLRGVYSRWFYIEFLTKNGWLHTTEEQPHNYPYSHIAHDGRWRRLQDSVQGLLLAKRAWDSLIIT